MALTFHNCLRHSVCFPWKTRRRESKPSTSGAGFGAGDGFATVAKKPDDADGVVVCCAEIYELSDALNAERVQQSEWFSFSIVGWKCYVLCASPDIDYNDGSLRLMRLY
jgi:hypothetical protein